MCVCVCVCLSVYAIIYETVDRETSFLVWLYILTISRSSPSVNVTGSISYIEKCLFGYLDIIGFICLRSMS